MLKNMSSITKAATKRIEFTGVRRRGCRRANQRGTRLSHPAVIGRRVRPVKIRLALATARIISREIANGAAQPASPKALRMVCGMGPITLMGFVPTKVSTELVPRMNISAMIGAEITTDCPMVRAALRDSPARMATYSNPLSAPTVIWPKIARPNHDGRGGCHGIGYVAILAG